MWLFNRHRQQPAPAPPRSVVLPEVVEAPLALAERSEFMQRVAGAIARAREHDGTCALVAWELRALPGAAVDTETVRRSAALLLRRLRADDVVTRYDERRYLALAAEADEPSARSAAFRIKRDLGMATPDAGKWLSGTAVFPRDGKTPEQLIAAALQDVAEDLWR